MRHCLTLVFFLSLLQAYSQSHKVLVTFVDKDYASYDPYCYLSSQAIDRRILNDVPVKSFSDAPVLAENIRRTQQLMDSVRVVSRWLNGIVGWATDAQLDQLEALPGVHRVTALCIPRAVVAKSSGASVPLEIDLELLSKQVQRMGLDTLKATGLNGAGVTIAVFDAGFPQVNTSPWFAHIRSENRIIHTYDFVKNNENVYLGSEHGTGVLSCIAGKKGALQMGLATGANFMLARTERARLEPFSEEENWLKAAEWADKNGADIISSSLGYTYHRYFPEEMDGQISLVAQAARFAARKGILVINAAGNEGDSEWKHLVTPADVDSVLAVGGIDPETEMHINFSSFGPNAIQQRKPNVAAYGEAIVWWKDGLKEVPGTSFATPLVAGFAACTKQHLPQSTMMELFNAVENSGELAPYYDYAHGTGMPQAKKMLSPFSIVEPTFEVIQQDGQLSFSFPADDALKSQPQHLYIQKSSRGQLRWYQVIDVSGVACYVFGRISRAEDSMKSGVRYLSGDVLRMHYLGYTQEITIE